MPIFTDIVIWFHIEALSDGGQLNSRIRKERDGSHPQCAYASRFGLVRQRHVWFSRASVGECFIEVIAALGCSTCAVPRVVRPCDDCLPISFLNVCYNRIVQISVWWTVRPGYKIRSSIAS